MENPRAVSALFWSTVAMGVLGSLALSVYLRDFSVFLAALGVLLLIVVGCAGAALFLGITIAPLVWLLSRFSGRGPKRKG